MYTDSTLKPIQDGQQYTAPDGTKYPGNYPKDSIAGLYPVALTPMPEDGTIVTGFTINEQHTQIWLTRAKTANDLNDDIKSQIAALEAQQTPRRLREALSDPSFLNKLESDISALRAQLK